MMRPTRSVRCLSLTVLAAVALAAGEAMPAPLPRTWDAKRSDAFARALDVYLEAPAGRRPADLLRTLRANGLELGEQELNDLAAGSERLPGEPAPQAGFRRVGLQEGPGTRSGWFALGVPDGYRTDRAWPVALVLHDAGGDADDAMRLAEPLRLRGWLVVCPSSPRPASAAVAAAWCGPDDLAIAARALDAVARRTRIEPRRIAGVGVGVGADAALRLAAGTPQLWSALAVQGPQLRPSAADALRLREVPVRCAGAAGQALQRAGLTVDGTGAGFDPETMAVWTSRQPPRAASPWPTLVPPGGARPWWRTVGDPVGLDDPADPVTALLAAGRSREALALLDRRIAAGGGDRSAYLLRAVARVPGLRDPLPQTLGLAAFLPSRGWTVEAERLALTDLQAAVACEPDTPDQAMSVPYCLAARIWGKRAVQTMGAAGYAWVPSYQKFVVYTRTALRLDPANLEAALFAEKVVAALPAEIRAAARGEGTVRKRQVIPGLGPDELLPFRSLR